MEYISVYRNRHPLIEAFRMAYPNDDGTPCLAYGSGPDDIIRVGLTDERTVSLLGTTKD